MFASRRVSQHYKPATLHLHRGAAEQRCNASGVWNPSLEWRVFSVGNKERPVQQRLFTSLFTAAALLFAAPSAAEVLITVDKSAQRMTVVVDGKPRWRWPVSTGAHGYDTPTGSYTAFRMEKVYFSKEWDDAPMPNSIFFTKRGHAIHGSYDGKHLGRPVSHGCVRLNPANAAKLFALVESQGVTNAKVVITGRNI
jgi:lipoprotein-anchoring transpeptidase ErfK/SrfK